MIAATHGKRAVDKLAQFKPHIKEHEMDAEVEAFEQIARAAGARFRAWREPKAVRLLPGRHTCGLPRADWNQIARFKGGAMPGELKCQT